MHYGIIDEDGLSLRHPRNVDDVFDSLSDAFDAAAERLREGVSQMSVCTARKRGEADWVEVDSLATLHAHPALHALEDGT